MFGSLKDGRNQFKKEEHWAFVYGEFNVFSRAVCGSIEKIGLLPAAKPSSANSTFWSLLHQCLLLLLLMVHYDDDDDDDDVMDGIFFCFLCR